MHPPPYRKLKQVLKDYYQIKEFSNRGKGSERMFARQTKSGYYDHYPIKCHGESDTVKIGSLLALLRHFNIDPKDFEKNLRK
jgi:hypothetical protein